MERAGRGIARWASIGGGGSLEKDKPVCDGVGYDAAGSRKYGYSVRQAMGGKSSTVDVGRSQVDLNAVRG